LKYGGFLSSITKWFRKNQFNILVRKIALLGFNLFIKIVNLNNYRKTNLNGSKDLKKY